MKVPFIFSVPFVNIGPIVVVPPGLPFGIDISAPYFRGIKPYRDYDLLDEVLRQSDNLDEREKIKWMTRCCMVKAPSNTDLVWSVFKTRNKSTKEQIKQNHL